MSENPLALFPVTAAVNDRGALAIAGLDLGALADLYGTPLYVFDARTVGEQASRLCGLLRQSYPGACAVAYAAKAYFSAGFARHVAGLGVEVDAVSLAELRTARQAGFAPDAIHLHGNNKSEAELQAALEEGIRAVVVDNLEELEMLEALAARRGQAARIWLRVTPDLDVRTHPHIATASAESKFGLHLENGQAAEALRRALASRWLDLAGLHFHLGSMLAETQPYQEAVERVLDLWGDGLEPPREFSPGGGWGVRYTDEDPPDDPRSWIITVSAAVKRACGKRGWRLPRLVIEPGRWLVARAGVALYTVGTQKETASGRRIVAVDGGLADNPRPALYGARYTARAVEQPLVEGENLVRLVGRYCESGDVLIPEVRLPRVRRGERIAVPVSGAYQLAMSSNYNLAPRPAVLWLDQGKAEVLQAREDLPGSGWWAAAGPG